jgi:sugar phosphate isomerase/epimerase
MATVKGRAIFLVQFVGNAAPFNWFDSICRWAASLGFKVVQIPSWDARLVDLGKAASSNSYCDALKGVAASHGLSITKLSTHLQGQLVAVNPAYDEAFDAFASKDVAVRASGRHGWSSN